MTFASGPVRVRVPATSANLGPGFDALGLALGLYDDVAAEVTTGGVRVVVSGEGAGELPDGDTHLVVTSMRAAFDVLGGQPRGLALECVNRIPQARGLGSSSAAIVAGVLLARALVADGAARLDDAAALRLASEIEGHPDNVAPCLLGGFTVAWTEPAGARAVSLAVADAVRPTVFVPGERGLTAVARAALPATVPHAEAALTAGRAALLVHALTAEPALLLPATVDRLHQDYRAAGMPATAALVAALREAGVAAVVSGAGPTVLALTEVPAGFETGTDWQRWELPIDVSGARVARGRLGHAERDPVAAGRKS
ncbi:MULTISPECIES: homoserine kinase [Micromonospora]|uniref:Homoserine kinase n=1 Tax=Micromonospora solifontis TaxID=2487138 RepID=A0ABX9WA41_9ACTN|nr:MULTISPECIES: homoserine kinase [Micromonospora]NES17137.1 homoserine kinase [Micromonospora sp. PPF5-17B]NES39104.1 homoserine kinase [Micromonospora solifontis]NES58850.1 homoserine kinase [Micromonospora sp. PPF5-6]RNL91113.1 homoserine kinase [Micromonospora solifontis]